MKNKFSLLLILVAISMTTFGQWIEQATGFATASRGVRDISIVDANTVWINAYDGSGGGANVQEFSLTTDGGSTWTPGTIDLGDTGLGIAMIWGVSATTAYVVGYPTGAGQQGGIFITTDSGATWTRQTSASYDDAASFANVVYFWDANNGFCQGDPIGGEYELYTTTDGGTTWVAVPGADIPDPGSGEYGYVGQYEVYQNTIWYTTNQGRIYHSTDMGYTWAVYDSPISDFGGTSESGTIAFTNATDGLLVNNSNQMWSTTDAGATWTPVTATGTHYPTDLAAVPGVPGAYINSGNTDGIAMTNYNGVYWEELPYPGQNLNLGWYDATTGWVGGFNTDAFTGGIYKFDGTVPTPYDNDIGVMAITNPVNGGLLTATENVTVEIMNYGLNNQSGFDVSYSINGGAVITENVAATIASGEIYSYSFTATEDFSAAGTYTVNAYTALGGDEDPANDGITEDAILMTVVPVKRPLHEVLTSSTCGPCASANPVIDGVCLDPTNAANSTLVKYQVNWPGAGDPYYIPTATDRVTFYGTSGVPDFKVDGNTESGVGYSQTTFDQYAALTAFHDITASHTITGTQVDVDITLSPYVDLNTTCYVAVVENITTGNVGTNGETQFHNVMMAMLPDANGTVVNLVAGTPHNFTLNVDMASTFVEEMSDLEVVIWLQDPTTKEVYQSNYSTFDVSVDDMIDDRIVSVYPNPSNGTFTIKNVENTKISVFNILGECVYSINNNTSEMNLSLDVPEGNYILKIEGSNDIVTKKIIISK